MKVTPQGPMHTKTLRFNHTVTEHYPFPKPHHHKHGLCLRKRNPRTTGETKAKTLRNVKPLAVTATENIKHSPTPSRPPGFIYFNHSQIYSLYHKLFYWTCDWLHGKTCLTSLILFTLCKWPLPYQFNLYLSYPPNFSSSPLRTTSVFYISVPSVGSLTPCWVSKCMVKWMNDSA